MLTCISNKSNFDNTIIIDNSKNYQQQLQKIQSAACLCVKNYQVFFFIKYIKLIKKFYKINNKKILIHKKYNIKNNFVIKRIFL